MSKKDKNQQQAQAQKQTNEVKKEQPENKTNQKVNNEKELQIRINELEKELIDQQASILEKENANTKLRNQIEQINNDYKNKAIEFSKQAQEQVDKKIKELQEKFELESKQNKKYALASSIDEFISILNQLDNAVNFETKDPNVKNFLIGFKMFVNQFKNWLKANGVEVIQVNVNDPFDSNIMEPVDIIKENDNTDYVVTKVVENGYKLYDRIIRPVKVIVTNKK